ncbi:MAG: endonuclease MutS2 [Lachnospiraceae bacterium]|nr:endonuclease MutS2 [Lachnospiraceae bacterium]
MNKKVLQTLEYNKIIERLAHLATCEAGRKKCEELLPSTDGALIASMQAETGDALTRIFRKSAISFLGTTDTTALAKRLEIGSTLNAAELLSVCSMLEVAKNAKQFGAPMRDDEAGDSLTHYFDGLEPLTPLSKEISRCIISEDEIADDASPTLKDIRRLMHQCNDKIRSQLNAMLSRSTTRDCLQDAVITMRGGRYCLPVRAEFKSQVPGLVHDQSGSGQTLFIEPLGVVEANNQLRELEGQEHEEIQRILAVLSQAVFEQIELIQQNFRILSELDFIFARGKLAQQMNAVAPIFNDKGIIRLREARHPLLDPKTVVPITLTLGEDFRLLIVTGPNTGGKTVSLKTVGLLSLMGQAGLFIPTKDRSELSIFDDIFADIGDEQSIEQSLSTFSSHMKNIVRILKEVDEGIQEDKNYLALFDELCAGTDPLEGAALATSILDRLQGQGVRTMATTHYSELKVYAIATTGVENACCEFDVETLSPTYRLLIGVPGKSNAFAISRKLGLGEDVVEDAKMRLDENDRSFEDLMSELEQKRVAIENDRAAIASDRAHIANMRAEVEKKQAKLNEQRDTILQEANQKASNILKDAKDTADAAIRNINKYGSADGDVSKLEATRANLGKKMKHTQSKSGNAVGTSKKTGGVSAKDLHIGDTVKVLSMNLTGTIHTLPNPRGDLEVQCGILRSKVNISDLELIMEDAFGKPKPKSRGMKSQASFSKAATISTEIKLLGMTADEAIHALDKYLDDAYISHLTSVRVVHGKGTGVLRKAVHEYLKKNRVVKSYHLAEFGEGDAGVTIVEFKE